MKIVCYDAGLGPRCGILKGTQVLDVTQLLQHATVLRDAQALLQLGSECVERLQRTLQFAHGVDILEVRLLSPILQPPTIRDFSVFEGHASMGGTWQLSEAWYRLPAFYFSNPLCTYGTGSTIPYPSATSKFDFEVELAAVIGREGRNVSAESAMEYVAGFVIFVDWSSRDLQRDEMQLHLGPAKGKDAANSFGPWLVTLDELAPLISDSQLCTQASLSVNGVEWVSGATGGMQHNWSALIQRASRDSRIVPGDVIGAGCITGGSVPEAIRAGRPARYLEVGDRIQVTLDGLGTLITTLGAPEVDASGYRFLPPIKKS